jgi:hypothetical protein
MLFGIEEDHGPAVIPRAWGVGMHLVR